MADMEAHPPSGGSIWVERRASAEKEGSTDGGESLLQDEEADEDGDTASSSQAGKPSNLVFGIKDTPPIQIILFYGIQVCFNAIVGPMTTAYLIYKNVCADGADWLYARLISTSMINCGICTIIQVLLGVRLPIFQGSSLLYVTSITAIFSTEEWACPQRPNMNGSVAIGGNLSDIGDVDLEPWNIRIATVSGNLALASVFHFLLGATGLVGAMMSYVGPLTLAPVIGMIGLCLYDAIIIGARHQWGVTLFVIAVALVFAVVMENVKLPMPVFKPKQGCSVIRIPLIKMFSSILALILGCVLCYILTVSGALPDHPDTLGYYARTDAKLEAVQRAPWFFIPYPGQYGGASAELGQVIAFLPVVVGSVMESLADYTGTAFACEVARPPNHAINRGIAVEGIGSIVGAVIGACHGTTSYSNMMGLISYSGVGSRIVWVSSGIILVVAGLFGKFGAILALVPDPVIAAMLVLALAMVFSMAMSSLSTVDLTSSRNQMVLGLPMVLGIAVPIYTNEYRHVFKTGVTFIDQVSVTCLSNAPLVSGAIAFVLDNLLPGTKDSRGIHAGADKYGFKVGVPEDIYSLPLPKALNSLPALQYIPFLPCYRGYMFKAGCRQDEEKDGDLQDVIILEGDDDSSFTKSHL